MRARIICSRISGHPTRTAVLTDSVMLWNLGGHRTCKWYLCIASWCNLGGSLLCDRDPAEWNSIFSHLVWRRGQLSRWQSPTRSPGLLVVQFASFPHGHLHDRNPDKIAVLPHISLTSDRSCSNVGENLFRSSLCAPTNDTRRGAFGSTRDLVGSHLNGGSAFGCTHCLSQGRRNMSFDRCIRSWV